MVERVTRIDRQPFCDGKSEAATVVRVRSQVEVALQEHFGTRGHFVTAPFRGKLSTVPERVAADVSEKALRYECQTFSTELADGLEKVGQRVQVSTSAWFADAEPHWYLLAEEAGVKIIIDPTIGQFIAGHNHVFVGTRDQLWEVVGTQTGIGRQYAFGEAAMGAYTSIDELFEVMWGSNSRPANQKSLAKHKAFLNDVS